MITLTASAHCQRCAWTAAGTMAEADSQAGKHTKATGHPTVTAATPATTQTTAGSPAAAAPPEE